MAYITQDDLTARITPRQLIQLTDDTNSGAVDADIVNAVLEDATAEIDSYCRARYQVPLQPSGDVTRIARDIAVYMLYSRRPGQMPESVKDRYDGSVKLLLAISKGNASLDQPTGAPEPQTPTGTAFVARDPNERFTERNLEGYC